MPKDNSSIISIKPVGEPKYPKIISIGIEKIHEIISKQDNQKAMDFLYEILDPYYPECPYCGNIFFTENPRRMYCDDCKARGIQNKLWTQNHIEQDRRRKREWARKNKLNKEEPK
jgi:hypothetical protein